MAQAQTGKRASTPKVVKVRADDNLKLMYKNLGNNHNYPFMFGFMTTIVSGTSEVTIASGITLHGHNLATYGNVTASPLGNAGDWYVDKDTGNNIIKIKTTSTLSEDIDFDVAMMMGVDPDLDKLVCR